MRLSLSCTNIINTDKNKSQIVILIRTKTITKYRQPNDYCISLFYINTMISGRNINLALVLKNDKRVKYVITYCNITNTRGVYGILLNSEEIKENIYVLNTTEYQL